MKNTAAGHPSSKVFRPAGPLAFIFGTYIGYLNTVKISFLKNEMAVWGGDWKAIMVPAYLKN